MTAGCWTPFRSGGEAPREPSLAQRGPFPPSGTQFDGFLTAFWVIETFDPSAEFSGEAMVKELNCPVLLIHGRSSPWTALGCGGEDVLGGSCSDAMVLVQVECVF